MAGTESVSAAVNRRRFLLASGATAAAGVAGTTAGALLPRQREYPAVEPAARTVAQRPPRTAPRTAPYALTTLETTARLGGSAHTGTYRRMVSGPGWPLVVRKELAKPGAGRQDRRTPLACFVQFTDLHLADVQNPLRTEFLRSRGASSWRAQEALTVAGAVALVEQVNGLGGGPNTRLRPAFVMTTGDNVDNNSAIELEWFLTVMSGGRITPNTGDPRRTKAPRTPVSPCTGTPGTPTCATWTSGADCP